MVDDQETLDDHKLQVQRLFVEHRQAVLAYVLSLEPGINEAEEIVQETFLKVSQKACTWTQGTNFLAWTFAVARYTTLSYQRDRGRRRFQLADDVAELLADDIEEDFAGFQEQVSALRGCLNRLAPKAKQMISLRYHTAKMPEEIASEVGWSVNAVRVALTRARQALRNCLETSLGRTS